MLRKAFAAVVADPELKAELAKRNMEFGPLTGEEMQKLVETTLRHLAADRGTRSSHRSGIRQIVQEKKRLCGALLCPLRSVGPKGM